MCNPVAFPDQNKALKEFLIQELAKDINKEQLARDLVFSYLAARICYSNTYPIRILLEEKFLDKEKRIRFLMALYRNKHFSVFAHTPIRIPIIGKPKYQIFDIHRLFFKVFEIENGDYLLFNLRHFAEYLPEEEFKELISVDIPDWRQILDFKKEATLKSIEVVLFDSLQMRYTNAKVFLFNSSIPCWKVAVFYNCSRVAANQIVRHTTANFNQRSHRYTECDGVVIPRELLDTPILEHYFNVMMLFYNDLKDVKNVKNEVKRYFMPMGANTTLMISAPLCVWKDFVEKRNIPQAQEETREIASVLQKMLFNEN